jgi:hypothetical protein
MQEEHASNGGLGSRREQSHSLALSPSTYSNHNEIPISPIGALPRIHDRNEPVKMAILQVVHVQT